MTGWGNRRSSRLGEPTSHWQQTCSCKSTQSQSLSLLTERETSHSISVDAGQVVRRTEGARGVGKGGERRRGSSSGGDARRQNRLGGGIMLAVCNCSQASR